MAASSTTRALVEVRSTRRDAARRGAARSAARRARARRVFPRPCGVCPRVPSAHALYPRRTRPPRPRTRPPLPQATLSQADADQVAMMEERVILTDYFDRPIGAGSKKESASRAARRGGAGGARDGCPT